MGRLKNKEHCQVQIIDNSDDCLSTLAFNKATFFAFLANLCQKNKVCNWRDELDEKTNWYTLKFYKILRVLPWPTSKLDGKEEEQRGCEILDLHEIFHNDQMAKYGITNHELQDLSAFFKTSAVDDLTFSSDSDSEYVMALECPTERTIYDIKF